MRAAVQKARCAFQVERTARHVSTSVACATRNTSPERAMSPHRGCETSGCWRSWRRPSSRLAPTRAGTMAARIHPAARRNRLRRSGSKRRSVDVSVTASHRLGRESRERVHPAGRADGRAPIDATDQVADGRCERVSRALLHQNAGAAMLDAIGQSAGCERDDGRLAKLRFDGHEPETLEQGWNDQRSRLPIERHEVRLPDGAVPSKAGRESERRGSCFERAAIGAVPYYVPADVRWKQRNCIDEQLDPFLRHQPADKEKIL